MTGSELLQSSTFRDGQVAIEIKNKYVDYREGGYYIAGTRIGLDVIVYEFSNGQLLLVSRDASTMPVHFAISITIRFSPGYPHSIKDASWRHDQEIVCCSVAWSSEEIANQILWL